LQKSKNIILVHSHTSCEWPAWHWLLFR